MRDARFWITMVIFQAAFGLTVFALTRHYYLASAPPSPLPAWALGVGAALPIAPATPAGPFTLAPPLSLPPVASASPPSNDPAAISQRADAAFTGGNYAEAAALYDQLLAIDPQNVELYNNLGLTLHYLGKSNEALETLAAGLKLDPKHQRSWLTTGFVNLRLGNAAEARAALVKARDAGDDKQIRESAEKMLADLPQ
jgi:tetratricopeptide (TPR) repeat protein